MAESSINSPPITNSGNKKKKTRGFISQLDPDDYSLHDIELLRIERMSDEGIWMSAYPANGGEPVRFSIHSKAAVDMFMEHGKTTYRVAR